MDYLQLEFKYFFVFSYIFFFNTISKASIVSNFEND